MVSSLAAEFVKLAPFPVGRLTASIGGSTVTLRSEPLTLFLECNRSPSTFVLSSRLARAISSDSVRSLRQLDSKLNCPGWDDASAHALALTLAGFDGDSDLHIMFNIFWESLDFELPIVPGRGWCLSVDTSRPSPHDIADPGSERDVLSHARRVEARSVAVLMSRP